MHAILHNGGLARKWTSVGHGIPNISNVKIFSPQLYNMVGDALFYHICVKAALKKLAKIFLTSTNILFCLGIASDS